MFKENRCYVFKTCIQKPVRYRVNIIVYFELTDSLR